MRAAFNECQSVSPVTITVAESRRLREAGNVCRILTRKCLVNRSCESRFEEYVTTCYALEGLGSIQFDHVVSA